MENTAQKVTLVLPAAPTGELSEEELDRVAGGGHFSVFVSDAQVIARAWREVACKGRRLAAAPQGVHDMGPEVPAGIEVAVVENTAQKVTLVLPVTPTGELSDDPHRGAVRGGTGPRRGGGDFAT